MSAKLIIAWVLCLPFLIWGAVFTYETLIKDTVQWFKDKWAGRY